MKEEIVNEKVYERIEWIDAAKGLAIILVVLGHAPIPEYGKYVIYGCHIPLFFILSGMTIRFENYVKFRTFFVHKFNSLIKPYFIFSIIEFIIYYSYEYNIYTYSSGEIIRGILFPSGQNIRLNPVLWFLPCLFVAEILMYILNRMIKRKWQLAIVLIILAGIGAYYRFFFSIRAPFFLDCALTAIIFLEIGYFYKKYLNYHFKTVVEGVLIVGGLLAVYLCALFINTRVAVTDLFNLSFNNIVLYYIHSISGSLFLISLCKMRKYKYLERMGKNSLYIFAFHPNCFILLNYIIDYLRRFLDCYFTVFESWRWGIVYTIFAIVFILLILLLKKCIFCFFKE